VGDGVWEARFGVHYIMCVLTPTKKNIALSMKILKILNLNMNILFMKISILINYSTNMVLKLPRYCGSCVTKKGVAKKKKNQSKFFATFLTSPSIIAPPHLPWP
jgi:hypothetical protein